MSGCAHAEGYYKIDPRDKVKYLPHHRSKTKPAGRTSKVGERGDGGRESKGREGLLCQRPRSHPAVSAVEQWVWQPYQPCHLASVFSSGDISSDLAKYNQLRVGGVWERGLWERIGVSGVRRVVAPPSSGLQETAQVFKVQHSQLVAVCDGGHSFRRDGD